MIESDYSQQFDASLSSSGEHAKLRQPQQHPYRQSVDSAITEDISESDANLPDSSGSNADISEEEAITKQQHSYEEESEIEYTSPSGMDTTASPGSHTYKKPLKVGATCLFDEFLFSPTINE